MGDLLMKSVIKAATQHMNSTTSQLLVFLASCADDTDDLDSEGIRRTKGGDIFPSQLTMSLDIGVSRNQINSIMKSLLSDQWIKEHDGNKYILYIRNNNSRRRVKCYIINLAMLKRCLDVMVTMKHMRKSNAFSDMKELEILKFFKALSEKAATFREGDWEDKSWTGSYVPRVLNIQPTMEGIESIDWDKTVEVKTGNGKRKIHPVDENGNVIFVKTNDSNTYSDPVTHDDKPSESLYSNQITEVGKFTKPEVMFKMEEPELCDDINDYKSDDENNYDNDYNLAELFDLKGEFSGEDGLYLDKEGCQLVKNSVQVLGERKARKLFIQAIDESCSKIEGMGLDPNEEDELFYRYRNTKFISYLVSTQYGNQANKKDDEERKSSPSKRRIGNENK